MTFIPILDPPLTPEPDIQYWSYEKVRDKIAKEVDIPKRWFNPDIDVFPWAMYQGNRGTCVGFSTVYGLVLLYWRITGDYPTDEQMKMCKKNVEEDLGSCRMVTYKWFPQMKSAGFAYLASREYGNVTYPSGSWLSASVGSLKVNGCCWEKEYATSLVSRCVPRFWPHRYGNDTESKVRENAKKHRIDGYLKVTTFEGICEAIHKYGFVLMPINVYSNYHNLKWDGKIGLFPDPSLQVDGSHALCWIGYDLDKRELYCLHSWGDSFPKIGGISEKYWKEAAGPAFVVLDSTEDKVEIDVAEKLYTRVTCKSNVQVKWFINDVERPGQGMEFSAMFERHQHYKIVAKPVFPMMVKQSEIVRFISPINEEEIVEFEFIILNLREYILAMIKEILSKYFGGRR